MIAVLGASGGDGEFMLSLLEKACAIGDRKDVELHLRITEANVDVDFGELLDCASSTYLWTVSEALRDARQALDASEKRHREHVELRARTDDGSRQRGTLSRSFSSSLRSRLSSGSSGASRVHGDAAGGYQEARTADVLHLRAVEAHGVAERAWR